MACLAFVREAQPCGAGEQQHPFAFRLIVPEAWWARLPERDDPLEAQAGTGHQRVDAFGRAGVGERTQEVHERAFAEAGGAAATSTPVIARRHPVYRSSRSIGDICGAKQRSGSHCATIVSGSG